MARAVATEAQTHVRSGADGSSHPWAGIDAEAIRDLVAATPSRKGREPRVDLLNNLNRFAYWFRRRSAKMGPRFFCTWEQLIVGCGYDPKGDRRAQLSTGLRSAKRYTRLFEEAGLIAIQGRAGYGGGLWVELCDPRLHSAPSARSSAGSSDGSCEIRWRPESRPERAERRQRPWRRRRRAPHRFDVASGGGGARAEQGPLSFSPEEVPTSYGASPPSGPLGQGGEAKQHPGARARPDDRLDGAAQGRASAEGSAEGRGWVGEHVPPRRPPAWREVPAELRERVDALLADAGAVPELGPSRAWAAFVVVWGRQSAPLPRWRWEQLRRVLRRLDRYAAHGRGQAGAGIGVLVDLMLAHRLELPWEPRLPQPASLAYFLPELERISRKWRRDQDPERRRRSAEHRARRGHRYERQGRELRKRGRRRGR